MSRVSDFSLVLQSASALQQDPFASPEFASFYHHNFAPQSHRMGGRVVAMMAAAAVRSRGRVLEIGAGTGLTADDLARQRPDLSVLATDHHEGMLDAGASALAPPPNLTRQVADAEALPFPDESFDAAWSVGLLRYVSDPRQVVAELVRVLRPGGSLFVTDIAAWTPWRLRARVAQDMPVPMAARPLLVIHTFREAGRRLGSRETVRALFQGHADAEPFEGLSTLHDEADVPLPCFLATLRRR